VKRWTAGLCTCLVLIGLLSACSPNKEMGTEDRNGNQAKFEAYGINLRNDNQGTDKGPAGMIAQKVVHNREPELIARLESAAERIPGVVDLKILAYKDNLLVGVLTADTPRSDEINKSLTIPHRPDKIVRVDNGHTDDLQRRVTGRLLPLLQAQSRFNIMYVCTNRALYDRIADIHARIRRGEPVSDGEFQELLNDIGYTVKGFNLVD